ncbi:MAG: nitroreductase [Hydrogenophaga sp.]|nr:nitroreductase [Hydrogenophaga sp.]
MDKSWSTSEDAPPHALLSLLMEARQTVLPKRLLGPGPDPEELRDWLASATSAPDHDLLRPWRLIVIPDGQRARLGQAFADALLERDPAATSEQIDQAREKALRAPVLLVVVVDGACGDPGIDLHERIVSAGCAVQNLMLMATARGWGSALTSGKALKSSALRTLLSLEPDQHALCCLSVGTVTSRRPGKPRPQVDEVVQTLTDQGLVGGLRTGAP